MSFGLDERRHEPVHLVCVHPRAIERAEDAASARRAEIDRQVGGAGGHYRLRDGT
jgi:hypothetical protein